MRFHIIRNARIDNVGKYQSCMVSKVRIIWKQTVRSPVRGGGLSRAVDGAAIASSSDGSVKAVRSLQQA